MSVSVFVIKKRYRPEVSSHLYFQYVTNIDAIQNVADSACGVIDRIAVQFQQHTISSNFTQRKVSLLKISLKYLNYSSYARKSGFGYATDDIPYL